jgi:hypothetical protein
MKVTAKVGSTVQIPIYQGLIATSSAPAVCSCTIAGNTLTLKALTPGTAWVEIQFASDLKGSLQLNVVA